MKIMIIGVVLAFTGCAMGHRMSELNEGMDRAEVEAKFGRPDGFKRVGDYEVLSYSNRLASGWAWDRADYHAILKDNQLVEWGQGEVRVKDGPQTQTLFIVPVR